MIYVMGILGFFGGFIFGQMVLYFFLRHKSKDELLKNGSLKWTYGLANWVFAGLGSYGLIALYQQYFL
mgnify:CR=1 FL=1